LSVNQLSVFLSATLVFFLADMDTGAEFFPHAPTNALAAESGADHFYSWHEYCCAPHIRSLYR
jgi:hypothetical protein